MVEQYDDTLSSLLESHAPMKKACHAQRPRCEWYSEEIHEAIRRRRLLERLWRSTGLAVHKDMFKAQRNHVNYLLNSAKTQYIRDKITECKNPKELHATLGHLMGRDICRTTMADTEKCEEFSDYFADKILKIQAGFSASTATLDEPLSFQPRASYSEFHEMSSDEVSRVVQSMNTKHCSLDPIPTWILKKCIPSIAPVLTRLANLSLHGGGIPDHFKTAKVTPILKKPSLDSIQLKNYRAISNLTFTSKFLEKAVCNQLNGFLSQHSLTQDFQSAYRAGASTETALLRVQNDILLAIDSKQVVLLVMLDLSSAFDTVDHSLLIHRLHHHFGVHSTALQWLKTYLSGRHQYVYILGPTSQQRALTCGVPQGSVLGPLLYTLYTTPLGNVIRQHGVQMHLYADDTQLYVACVPSDVGMTLSRLEACLKDVHDWMIGNRLQLNASKTEFIIFGSQTQLKLLPSGLTVEVGKERVKSSNVVKNIGVTLDTDLKITDHISTICKQSMAAIRKIGKVRKYVDNSTAQTLVHQLVTNRMDYCNSLLYGIPSVHLDRLQRLQNLCARIVLRLPRRDSARQALHKLHWLPVQNRILYKLATLMFKAQHSGPAYLADLIHPHTSRPGLRSEDDHLCAVPRTRLKTYGDRAFSKSGPSCWNKLPIPVRSARTLGAFKKGLKTTLFNISYHDL